MQIPLIIFPSSRKPPPPSILFFFVSSESSPTLVAPLTVMLGGDPRGRGRKPLIRRSTSEIHEYTFRALLIMPTYLNFETLQFSAAKVYATMTSSYKIIRIRPSRRPPPPPSTPAPFHVAIFLRTRNPSSSHSHLSRGPAPVFAFLRPFGNNLKKRARKMKKKKRSLGEKRKKEIGGEENHSKRVAEYFIKLFRQRRAVTL